MAGFSDRILVCKLHCMVIAAAQDEGRIMQTLTEEKPVSKTFVVLLVVATVAFLLLFVELYKPVLWAAVIALLFQPVYEFFCRQFSQRKNLAAASTVLLVLLAVVLPTFLFALAVGKEAASYVDDIRDGKIDPAATLIWLGDLVPSARSFLESVGLETVDLSSRVGEAVATAGEFVTSKVLSVGQGAVRFVVSILLMLYLIYYFLIDGKKLLTETFRALPLSQESENRLANQIAVVAKATVKSLLVMGVIQGVLGAITFALLGIRGAILWGVAMAISSIVPVVGTSLVWLPAALVLIAAGHWVKALILIGVGAFVIGTVDNLLRPVLVGRDADIPNYIVLLATLGALGLVGLSGFIVGPLVAAIFLTSWQIYASRQTTEPCVGRSAKQTVS